MAPGEAETFAYRRALAPMMWVFFALALIETAVVHLLVALWNPLAALLLALLSLPALAWLVLLIRSFGAIPVTIVDGRLRWPCGRLRVVEVPLPAIKGLRSQWDGKLVKQRTTFNAGLLAYPNVVVELGEPVALGRRRIERLAHKLDDPGAFARALSRLLDAP